MTRRLGSATAHSLSAALPELVAAEARLRAEADALGIGYRIADWGGVRTQADTTQLLRWRDEHVARGGTTYPVAPWGRSYHNFGAAFDVKITRRRPNRTDRQELQALGALAPKVGLRWGGLWSGTKNDPFHFELPITLADARQRWQRHSGTTAAGVPNASVLMLVGLAALAWWFLAGRSHPA